MGTREELGRVVMTACCTCPLRTQDSFAANQVDEIEFIQRLKKVERTAVAGEAVIREKGSPRELYTVLSGLAFRFRTLSDGRRQILNFLFPGDFVGLQERMTNESPHGVEALTDMRLCVFPSERLWDLYRAHPSLGYDITWLTAHEELIVDENLLSVGRRSALERIAMLLLHFYKRAESVGMGGPDGVLFPITQQHIADALGLSLVHTNKTLKRLQGLGLHEIANGRLRIGDLHGLQHLAEYHALPLRERPLI